MSVLQTLSMEVMGKKDLSERITEAVTFIIINRSSSFHFLLLLKVLLFFELFFLAVVFGQSGLYQVGFEGGGCDAFFVFCLFYSISSQH